MLINLLQVINDYKGEAMTEEVIKKENGNIDIQVIPLTLKSVLLTALNIAAPGEIYSTENKVHANDLSIKIWNNEEFDFTPEDIVFLKERVGIVWNSPSVYTEALKMLDNKVQN